MVAAVVAAVACESAAVMQLNGALVALASLGASEEDAENGWEMGVRRVEARPGEVTDAAELEVLLTVGGDGVATDRLPACAAASVSLGTASAWLAAGRAAREREERMDKRSSRSTSALAPKSTASTGAGTDGAGHALARACALVSAAPAELRLVCAAKSCRHLSCARRWRSVCAHKGGRDCPDRCESPSRSAIHQPCVSVVHVYNIWGIGTSVPSLPAPVLAELPINSGSSSTQRSPSAQAGAAE